VFNVSGRIFGKLGAYIYNKVWGGGKNGKNRGKNLAECAKKRIFGIEMYLENLFAFGKTNLCLTSNLFKL